jgi:acyl-CoA synthetase (AMP-forming)/AMP-acid ligase II
LIARLVTSLSLTRSHPNNAEASGKNTADPYGWLANHATTCPHAPALHVWERGAIRSSWTWRELKHEVDRGIHGLARAGVSVSDRVVMALPNNATFVSVMLACSGLGAIAVPVPVPSLAVSRRLKSAFAESLTRAIHRFSSPRRMGGYGRAPARRRGSHVSGGSGRSLTS